MRLSAGTRTGVDVDRSAAPGASRRHRRGPPHRCGLVPGGHEPRGPTGRLAEALGTKAAWEFLHIASHGAGTGFTSSSTSGRGEIISAARRSALKWPEAVLMASCHVGRSRTRRPEPLSLSWRC